MWMLQWRKMEKPRSMTVSYKCFLAMECEGQDMAVHLQVCPTERKGHWRYLCYSTWNWICTYPTAFGSVPEEVRTTWYHFAHDSWVTLESWEPRASSWCPDHHQEHKILFEEGEIREVSVGRPTLGTGKPTCGREGT